LPTPLKFIAEGDQIRWLASFVEVEYRFIDEAMGLAVEIFGAQESGDFKDGVTIEKEAA
jgi:hypothetical protein